MQVQSKKEITITNMVIHGTLQTYSSARTGNYSEVKTQVVDGKREYIKQYWDGAEMSVAMFGSLGALRAACTINHF